MSIAENIARIRAQMNEAAARCGRDPASIQLCAATKMNGAEAVREAIAGGVDCCGENRVQELVQKEKENAYAGAPVHFIGVLQTNKVKQVVGHVDLIQSVDRRNLMEAIEKEAAKKDLCQDILLEINIGGEESKGGVVPEEAEELLRQVAALDRVKVQGLMTVAPPGDEEENRPYFRRMRELRDHLASLNLPGVEMKELSMGMTDDFETAISEGATIIRVGTAIFGHRSYDAPEWKP